MNRHLLPIFLAFISAYSAYGQGIIPYVRNYINDWDQEDVIQANSGDSFSFGPQSKDGDNDSGNWSWTGPNGFTRTNRDIRITNVTTADAGIYTVTYTKKGETSTHEFKVYVDGKLSADEVLPTYPANATADASYEAFNKLFLHERGDNKTTQNNNWIPRYFYWNGIAYQRPIQDWCNGLVLQMLTDRYLFRGDEAIKPLISKLLDSFCAHEDAREPVNNHEGVNLKAIHDKYSILAKNQQLSDWTWNFFNDDLIWMSLPFVRAYLITGEQRFLNQAKWGFEYIWARGFDYYWGGGIWWSNNQDAKSALSNGTAVCLSAYLYEATGDEIYLERAIKLYDWVCTILRDNEGGDSDGAIYENIGRPEVDKVRQQYYIIAPGPNVYSAGSFIEGATALYRITGDERYFNDAKRTFDWVMRERVDNNGIMGRRQDSGTWQSEFARGAGFFFQARPDMWKATAYYGKGNNRVKTTYYEWMRKNADRAWSSRDKTYNVSGTDWTNDYKFDPNSNEARGNTELYVGTVIMQQVVPTENPWKDGEFKGMSIEVPTFTDKVIYPKTSIKDKYGWFESKTVGLAANESVALRVDGDIKGDWTWTDPNGEVISGAKSNILSISKFTKAQNGEYVATCETNDGSRAVAKFYVSVVNEKPFEGKPYIQYGSGWKEETDVNVPKGSTFEFGPQSANTTIQENWWQWYGPNGVTHTGREFKVNNPTEKDAGQYVAVVKDVLGRRAALTYNIKVGGVAGPDVVFDSEPEPETGTDPEPGSVNDKDQTPIAEIYANSNEEVVIYDLMGRRIDASQLRRGIYIINNKKVIIR